MSPETTTQLAVEPAPTFDLLSDGASAFARIVRRVDEARRRIFMRTFEWRDDEIGQSLARAVLRAADRGVAVTILKDRMGMHYEYLEGSNQSFFHKKIALPAYLQTRFLMAGYGRWASLRQQHSPLADALANHENVTLRRDDKRFDHAKVFVFDDERVILGGMGIGRDFHDVNVDFMVEVHAADAATRLADRYEGRASFDPSRSFDYLLHSFQGRADKGGTLAAHRLALIDSARQRLTIEMAYLGDRACTEALVAAVRRGVFVTLLTSARANVIGDLNLYTCDQLLRRTGDADNLRIVLHPRMVHGKAMVGDRQWVDIGSTNFTPLSHGVYEEVDLCCRDAHLAESVEAAIERDIQDGTPVRGRVPYRWLYATVERAIVAHQLRTSRRR
jgi:cardiolipin synthase